MWQGELMTTPTKLNISLCTNCNCMTKTIKGKCGKCRAIKPTKKRREIYEI